MLEWTTPKAHESFYVLDLGFRVSKLLLCLVGNPATSLETFNNSLCKKASMSRDHLLLPRGCQLRNLGLIAYAFIFFFSLLIHC